MARVQQAPASRIAIDLPDGYEPAKLFSGFIHERLGVSLVIVEMPGRAYEELAKGLTPAALAAKGVTVVRQAKLSRPDEHIFIEGEQVSPAGAFAKYLVVFRDGDVTALITANVQKGMVTLTGTLQYAIQRGPIMKAVQSVPGISRIVDQMILVQKKPQQ